jgi:hypothetical protein
MAAVEEQPAVDADKLMGFVFRAVDEVGPTLNTALVVMGDRLGFYHALAGAGPLTPAETRRADRDHRASCPRVAERADGRRLRRLRPRQRPLHPARGAWGGLDRRIQACLPFHRINNGYKGRATDNDNN